MGRFSAATAVMFGALLVAPAAAQFGSIFGPPPPPPPTYSAPQRPPAPVPGGRQSMPTPGPGPTGPYGGIQSQPLPPPGAYPIDPPPRSAPPQNIQRTQRNLPPPTDPSPQPGDQVMADSPALRIVNNAALFTGLDKITGRIINFDVAIGETVQFGALQLTPRACYSRPAAETTKPDAFVEVDEVTLQGEVRRIFTGWMYAASPGLHAVEHSIYDIWLTNCKDPAVAAEKPPEPAAPAARAQQTSQPKQQPQQQRRPQQQSPR